MSVRVLSSNGVNIISWNDNNPPTIFFDTNVWRSMKDAEMATLQHLQQNFGFRYRYSVTNFIELASHLEDQPQSCQKPYQMFQSCFHRISKLCDREILPSPEMIFLANAGLSHYIDDAWIPNVHQTSLAVELITNANSLAELIGEEEYSETTNAPRYVMKPSHYRNLRDIDGNSMRVIMDDLREFKRPILVDNRLVRWFQNLAHFFLFVRPTNGRMLLKNTTKEEHDRFYIALMEGVGQLFQTHCMMLVIKTINDGRKVYPNDLYDMLQLILLENDNTLFVTSEKSFFRYEINQDQPKRVLPWTNFVSAA